LSTIMAMVFVGNSAANPIRFALSCNLGGLFF
jgi:hypothetical protein